jgi:hypothetical protein
MRNLILAVAAFSFVASAEAHAEDLPVRAEFKMYAGAVEILELDRTPVLAVAQDEKVARGDVLAGARVSIQAREAGRTSVVFRGLGGETILHAVVRVAPREERPLRAVTVRSFNPSAGAYETRSYFVGR